MDCLLQKRDLGVLTGPHMNHQLFILCILTVVISAKVVATLLLGLIFSLGCLSQEVGLGPHELPI